jgi:hypothetical protein
VDYSRIDRDDQTIRIAGPLALVFNRVSISIAIRGVRKELSNRTLAVWSKDTGAWQLIVLQSTAIA